MAKLRVGWMVAGWAPGVWTMCRSSWFHATATAPELPPASGTTAALLPLLATAVAAPTTPIPRTIPTRTIRATIDFFMYGFSCIRELGCCGTWGWRRILEPLLDPADGAVEQLT